MAANANGMGMAEQNEIQVEKKIDRVLQLLGMVAVKGLSQTDQIATLSRVGFSPKEIAGVLGTTANTVRVALVSIRRAGRQKKKRPVLRIQEGQDA